MIKQFERLESCGIFQNFRWSQSTPDFKRINVIFGSNGSGKTSLSTSIGNARTDTSKQGQLYLRIKEADQERSTNGHVDSIFNRIYVFNESYVGKSHRFTDATPTMQGVLTVGQRTIEAETELEALQKNLPNLIHKRDTAKSHLESAREKLQTEFSNVSIAVVQDLTALGGQYQSRSKYSRVTVESLFQGARDAWEVRTDAQISQDKQLIAADRLDIITLSSFNFSISPEIASDARRLISTTPASVLLDTLLIHPEATSWVNAGRRYHEHGTTCLYCGHTLSDQRKMEIDAHFSDAVTRIEEEIRNTLDRLAACKVELNELRAAYPSEHQLYKDMRPEFEKLTTAHKAKVNALISWIETLSQRLSFKLSNVLASIEDVDVAGPIRVDGDDLDALLLEHNNRVNDHDSHVQLAAKKIENHHLKQAESKVDGLLSDISAYDRTYEESQFSLDRARERVHELTHVEGDARPSAAVLTTQVARLLGRNELYFAEQDGRYLVTRHGEPAIGLSEGERTAITLVHFIEAVARHDDSTGKPIVLIDDPVSSLDSNVFMGASTYIWSECVTKSHVEQLFLLTHSFELFRQWDIQIEALHKNGALRRLHPAQFYELTPRYISAGGRSVRQPRIVSWPPNNHVRKKVRSSYHQAFYALVEAKERLESADTIENRMDAQLLFPNVIRRVLETFLGFKLPGSVGNFNESMRLSVDLLTEGKFEGDAHALRTHLTRFAHAYSHSENPDITDIVKPDEIGTAIVSLFRFMHAVDQRHFVGLCEVIARSPDSMLTLGDSFTSLD